MGQWTFPGAVALLNKYYNEEDTICTIFTVHPRNGEDINLIDQIWHS